MSNYGTNGQTTKDDVYDGRDKRALQYLVSLGERNAAQLVELPDCEHKRRWAFWNPVKGELELHNADPAPIGFEAASLDALRDMLLDQRKREIEGVPEAATEIRVFLGTFAAKAILNAGGNRLDRVAMAFEQTPAFEFLTACAAGGGLTQDALVLKLRTDLAGCDLSGLLKLVRTIRFEASSQSEGTVGAGYTGLSATAMKKAVLAGAEPPDVVEFEVHVYEKPALTIPPAVIRCALEIDVNRKLIYLLPRAGELTRAQDAATAAIAEYLGKGLREAGIPVWCGEPG
ncbi:MAG: hypothetical protein E6Q97_02660 [Desulfurellales bacterium]|nr:MAG: hypothetical protein E6Q97_02660 [Desulfurellales bacterium]